MHGGLTVVPSAPAKRSLDRRPALAAVIAESRGAVEAALRDRHSGPRLVALALWRAADRAALQPRFVQLGTESPDGGVRWGRAILLREESRNPLYRAAKERLLSDDGDDPAAAVLDELARSLSARLPCHVVDRRA